MADFTPVPRHVAAKLTVEECFDLIVTLRACRRELEGTPDSVVAMLDTLTAAYEAFGDGTAGGLAADDEAAAA